MTEVGEEFPLEGPTPRMFVLDLYRLEQERLRAHERIIRAIMHGTDTVAPQSERDSIYASEQEIRARLGNGQE